MPRFINAKIDATLKDAASYCLLNTVVAALFVMVGCKPFISLVAQPAVNFWYTQFYGYEGCDIVTCVRYNVLKQHDSLS